MCAATLIKTQLIANLMMSAWIETLNAHLLVNRGGQFSTVAYRENPKLQRLKVKKTKTRLFQKVVENKLIEIEKLGGRKLKNLLLQMPWIFFA